MTGLVTERHSYIDGSWATGLGAPITITSPGAEELVAEVDGATREQFESAVHAARRAFDTGGWPTLAPEERIAVMLRFADALEARRDALTETVIQEAGCPRLISQSVQVDMALKSVRELADLYGRMPAWQHSDAPLADYMVGSSVRLSINRYEAAGVVAAITPYNFPLITNVWKIVPALLAGCTAVLRPSPLTPLEALVFGAAADEAGIPAGVLNVVAEAGNEGGMLLSTHPDVDVVSFTGSTDVGRTIAAQAAPTLKRVILELGGKSVQLHLPDVCDDLTGIVGAAMTVFVSHAGQGCALQTRLLVPEHRRAAVVDAVAAAASSLKVGDPSHADTMVGPLITAKQVERIDGIVRDAVDCGGVVAVGGKRPVHLDRGHYYEPTVIDVSSSSNPVAQREVFGPVLAVQGYRDIDDAIAITNATPYGLSGGVYTKDLKLGVSIAERIRSGTVQVNTAWASGYTPMGGFKQSGYGRERGAAGIRAFQELKHIVVGSR